MEVLITIELTIEKVHWSSFILSVQGFTKVLLCESAFVAVFIYLYCFLGITYESFLKEELFF